MLFEVYMMETYISVSLEIQVEGFKLIIKV